MQPYTFRTSLALIGLLVAGLAPSIAVAQTSPDYTFRLIAENQGLPTAPTNIAINAAGDVAYQSGPARSANPIAERDIFRSDGVTATFIGVGWLGGINDAGEVVFVTTGGTAVLKSDGVTTTTIATGGPFRFADINNAGTVAFSVLAGGVYAVAGGSLATLVQLGDLSSDGRAFSRFEAVSISDNGDVVFKAETSGRDGIYLAGGGGPALLLADTRFDAGQPAESQYDAFGWPVISPGGSVSLWAESWAGTDGALVVPPGGSPAWHFYDSVGGSFGILDSVSVNDHGRLVMELASQPYRQIAVTDGPQGANNAAYERVVGEGDTLLARVVTALDMGPGNQRRINNRGDIVFYAQLLDVNNVHFEAIVRADRVVPEVTVIATDPVASEVGLDSGEFEFIRTGDVTNSLTVFFSLSGSATVNGDFTLPVVNSVDIPANAPRIRVSVTPVLDADTEGDETAIVTIVSNSLYRIGTPADATVTIADASARPQVEVHAIGNASEAGPTVGTFVVKRTGGDFSSELAVSFALSGSALAGVDYSPASATGVVIPAQMDTAVVGILPLADARVEGNESVVLSLVADASYDLGNPATATVVIADDPQVVTIVAGDPDASEQGLDPGTFTISRAGGSHSQSLSVPLLIGGSATNGVDYQLIANPVTIPAMASSVTVTMTPIADLQTEGAETVQLIILTSTDYLAGAASSATVTIAAEGAVVTLVASQPTADEIGPINGELTFTRTGDLSGSLTVNFVLVPVTCFGNRCPLLFGVDYRMTVPVVGFAGGRGERGQVEFAPGQSVLVTPVIVLPDSIPEGDETVRFVLQSGRYAIGTPSAADVTIRDAHPVGRAISDLGRQVANHLALTATEKNSLTSKLDATLDSLAFRRRDVAINQMNAFIQRVAELQRLSRLDAATANSWITQARSIIAAI